MKGILLAVLACGTATAGTTPISKLATKARADRHPTLPQDVSIEVGKYSEVTTTAPYCVVYGIESYEVGFQDWSIGNDEVDFGWRNLSGSSGNGLGIERLVVHGQRAELDRSVVGGYNPTVATDRGHIPLVVVARIDDLVVYAYRSGKTIFLVTPTTGPAGVDFESGRPEWGPGLVHRDTNCSYAITQIPVPQDGLGASGQITGSLQGVHGGSYRVDASVTKMSRDPEPLLSVTARFVDRL